MTKRRTLRKPRKTAENKPGKKSRTKMVSVIAIEPPERREREMHVPGGWYIL